jgi:hypothetical protein
MGSDQALSDSGTPFSSGVDSYTVGIFGQSRLTSPWIFQYGGHHLALNITIQGERGVIAPTLTGAQPSIRPTARRCAHSLDEAQRNKLFCTTGSTIWCWDRATRGR